MLRKFLPLLAASFCVLGLNACKEKSAAEKAAIDVANIRETKRLNAIKYYKLLAQKYPSHPHAAEATGHATQLEAMKK